MKLNVLVACELLDGPFEGIVLGNINCISCWSIETWTLDIFRHWHVDVHVVSNTLLLVVALHLYDESDLRIGWILHDDIHSEERLHSDIQTITHQFEFAIRRNECYQSFILESTQPHTLMELYIIEFNCLVLRCPSLCLVICLIVQA